MKKMLWMVALCGVLFGTGGCVISIKGDECRSEKKMPKMQPDPILFGSVFALC